MYKMLKLLNPSNSGQTEPIANSSTNLPILCKQIELRDLELKPPVAIKTSQSPHRSGSKIVRPKRL
jgi:hypothetical protein